MLVAVFRVLLCAAVSNSDCIVINGRMTHELQRIWKEGVMAYLR